jgi:hypothetical protein
VGAPPLDADGIAAIQTVLLGTGAVAEVERAIDDRVVDALDVLAGMSITSAAQDALGDLARFVAWRDR